MNNIYVKTTRTVSREEVCGVTIHLTTTVFSDDKKVHTVMAFYDSKCVFDSQYKIAARAKAAYDGLKALISQVVDKQKQLSKTRTICDNPSIPTHTFIKLQQRDLDNEFCG